MMAWEGGGALRGSDCMDAPTTLSRDAPGWGPPKSSEAEAPDGQQHQHNETDTAHHKNLYTFVETDRNIKNLQICNNLKKLYTSGISL